MAKLQGTTWPLEPHTAAKHAILRRYLQAWMPIITRWNGRAVYLDGFAGPGIYSNGEPGSPVIALTSAIEQIATIKGAMTFLFIEKDGARFRSLQSQIAALDVPSKFTVQATQSSCSVTLTGLLDDLDAKHTGLAPTFAFLDPFGFTDTPMSLIARLMSFGRCEVFITFMFEEINRFLSHPDQPNNFDALFGTTEWRDALKGVKPEDRRRFVKQLYQRQLGEVAKARYVKAFEMRNDANALDYVLFFATNSIYGLKKMKEAMWKVDPTGGLTFSDATDPAQNTLFSAEPDYDDVGRRIGQRFGAADVSVDEIERFLVEETPYRETHYKKLLKTMELASPARITVVSAPAGRKRGTFPSGTTIRLSGSHS